MITHYLEEKKWIVSFKNKCMHKESYVKIIEHAHKIDVKLRDILFFSKYLYRLAEQ